MRRLSELKILQYALFGAASALLLTIPNTTASFYLTNELAVDPIFVAPIFVVLVTLELAFRLFSGVIIQNTEMAWGKYRSWIVVLRWIIFAGSILMFIRTTALPYYVRIAIFALAYLALTASITFTQTAHFMLIVKMAGVEIMDRYRLSVRNMQLIAFVPLLSSYVLAPLANGIAMSRPSTQPEMVQNILHSLAFLLGAFVLTRVSRPYDLSAADERTGDAKQRVSEIFRSVFTNRSLLSLLTANLLLYVAIAISGGALTLYFLAVSGDMTLLPIAITASLLSGIAASLVMPYLGITLTKKKAMVTGLIIYAVLSVAMILFARESAILFIVLVCLKTAVLFLFQGFQAMYLIDSGEYELWKTGNDNRAVAVSLIDFPIKIGLALGALITAKFIDFFGLPLTPEIHSDLAGSFLVFYGAIPAVCTFIAALVMHFGYNISKEDAEKYIKENARRSVPYTQ